MTGAFAVRVWTMATGALTEPAVAGWRDTLDQTEQARAARFMFSRDRVAYVAAHALARTVLSHLLAGTQPRDWHFLAGAHGKPVACIGNHPAPVSFNLSHTHGIVGLAALATPDVPIGFDVEALDRNANLDVADRYFRVEEVDWLRALPADRQAAGFMRLWTLKEAFIKATGEGLTRDLASFWFQPVPPRIHFVESRTEQPDHWHFDQRVIGQRFIGAIGLRRIAGAPVTTDWIDIDASRFDPSAADQGNGEPLLRTLL